MQYGRHEIGFQESQYRCQMVAVFSLSNPKIYRQIHPTIKYRRAVIDYGKGIWKPTAKVGGTIRNSSYHWTHLVLDGHCYRIEKINELESKKRAIYVFSEPDARLARKCCSIFFNTLGKVMEGGNERT